jgi:hypothetical protein
VRFASDVTGKAEEVRDGVLAPFQVLARQAVRAVRDKASKLPSNELNGVVVRGVREEAA